MSVSTSSTHTHTPTPLYSWPLIRLHTGLQCNCIEGGGWELLLISPTTSAYSTVFACFTILLQCKALQGEINFIQSRFPAALGKRVYTSQFWWTRIRLCDFRVKSQVLGPWIVLSPVTFPSKVEMYSHKRCLLLMSKCDKLDFLHYHKWGDFGDCCTLSFLKVIWYLHVCAHTTYLFELYASAL